MADDVTGGRRVCLLTGAGGRLGSRFCQRHAGTYDIVAVYRSTPPPVPSQHQTLLDPLAPDAAVPENRHPVHAVRADLTDERDVDRVVEIALARFGRVDLLVNAAVHSIWAPMIDSDRAMDSMRRQFLTNVCVPAQLAVLLARTFWRDRPEENAEFNRNIVNVSSAAGVRIYPGSGQSVYSASKAALNYLSRHMAEEFGRIGVRTNVSAPDAFPRVVTTDAVVDSIVRLDAGPLNGKVLHLTRDGTRILSGEAVAPGG